MTLIFQNTYDFLLIYLPIFVKLVDDTKSKQCKAIKCNRNANLSINHLTSILCVQMALNYQYSIRWYFTSQSYCTLNLKPYKNTLSNCSHIAYHVYRFPTITKYKRKCTFFLIYILILIFWINMKVLH